MKEEPETPDASTLEEFLEAQTDERFCREQSESVGDPQSCFDYDQHGILARKAKLIGALQKVVPESLSHRLLHIAYYPVLAGHPGETQMYYTLKIKYYCPQIAGDVLSTVQNCWYCIRLQGAHF